MDINNAINQLQQRLLGRMINLGKVYRKNNHWQHFDNKKSDSQNKMCK